MILIYQKCEGRDGIMQFFGPITKEQIVEHAGGIDHACLRKFKLKNDSMVLRATKKSISV